MDKIRKLADRIWYNKERIVFAILVVILGWNAYRALNPSDTGEQRMYRFPKNDIGDRLDVKMPAPPDPPRLAQWKGLYTPNPFWFNPSERRSEGQEQSEEANIALLRIRDVRGEPRVQLRTASSTKWYSEGEQFESYQVFSIDPEAGTCQVRSERTGRNLTLNQVGQ